MAGSGLRRGAAVGRAPGSCGRARPWRPRAYSTPMTPLDGGVVPPTVLFARTTADKVSISGATKAMVKPEVLAATVPLGEYIAGLKTLAPEKATWLDEKLEAYDAGRMPASGVYSLLRMHLPHETLMEAFEKRVDGFKKGDMVKNHQHPTVV